MPTVRMVKGPAVVTIDGRCYVLGSNVSGGIIKVRAGKALPFEPGKSCKLHVRLGRGGGTWQAPSQEAGTSMWHNIAKQVSTLGKRATVMLVGDVDTGKSTLCTYLANVALGHGLVPCVVDGDIGQGDLGPPTSIGAAALAEPITDLSNVCTNIFEFVGATSPTGFEHIVAKKLFSILERVRPFGDIYIINTDGYVGIQYKQMLAEKLRPDAIVCLDNPALADTFEGGPWQVMRVRGSSQVIKTIHERKSRRLSQFLRHVGKGSCWTDLSQIKFVYMDRLFPSSELDRLPIMQLRQENIMEMFVALALNGIVKGFGVITGIDSHRICVQTDIIHFDWIYLSNIRLSGYGPVEIRLV